MQIYGRLTDDFNNVYAYVQQRMLKERNDVQISKYLLHVNIIYV